jgi:hypothetical protein
LKCKENHIIETNLVITDKMKEEAMNKEVEVAKAAEEVVDMVEATVVVETRAVVSRPKLMFQP